MPRDTGGVYTMPGGSFSPNTIILSNVMNSKFLDITDALTDSLSRSGDGRMLAPLRVPDGSVSIPTLAFTSDPGTGLYLSTTGDVRMAASATVLQQWKTTGVTIYPNATMSGTLSVTGNTTLGGTLTTTGATTLNGTTTVNAALSATGGIVGTNSTTNGAGVMGTGNALGPGLRGVGGNGGVGCSATGTNNHGGSFTGTGGGAGVVATGAASAPGAYARPGTAATASSLQYGLVLDQGHLSLDGAVAPASTTAVKNALTPSNIVKAWGRIVTNGSGSVTLTSGFNIASVSISGGDILVTFAQAFSDANYSAQAQWETDPFCHGYVFAAGSMRIRGYTFSAGPPATFLTANFAAVASVVRFTAVGHQ